jgi:hypothetical protein
MPARKLKIALLGGSLAFLPMDARSQEDQTEGQLPDVEVVQPEQEAPPPAAAKPKPRPRPAPAPVVYAPPRHRRRRP